MYVKYKYQRGREGTDVSCIALTMVKNVVVSSASEGLLNASLLVLIFSNFFISSCFGEERGLYLVTMEEDPVAFLGGYRLDQSQTR